MRFQPILIGVYESLALHLKGESRILDKAAQIKAQTGFFTALTVDLG
jgi:hypothetical protein